MKLRPEQELLLLRRIADGDHGAFNTLYRHYQPILLQYCRPFITMEVSEEEIVQEVFVEFWERRERAVNIHNVKSYLLQTAKNKLLNIHRHVLVVERMKQEFQTLPKQETAEDKLIFKEHYALFQNQMMAISPTKRQIFEGRIFDDKSNKQIATETKLSESMVKKHFKHVKSLFEIFVKKYQ